MAPPAGEGPRRGGRGVRSVPVVRVGGGLVNSAGAAINLTGSDLVDGRYYLFIYDGIRWLWVSANSADQIQIVGTVGNVVTDFGSVSSTFPSKLMSRSTFEVLSAVPISFAGSDTCCGTAPCP